MITTSRLVFFSDAPNLFVGSRKPQTNYVFILNSIFDINKAKAISAELMELTFKNKLEETGTTRYKGEETEKLDEKRPKTGRN